MRRTGSGGGAARDVRAQREHDLRSYIHKRVFRDADDVRAWPLEPPLIRVSLTMLRLQVSQPTSFALDDVHAWLHEQAAVSYTHLTLPTIYSV